MQPRRVASPLTALGGVALGLWACGSPGVPDLAPPGRGPEPPAANGCPAVGSPFGNRVFHLQDFHSRRVCAVYLEQDECVLGIWDDCTVEAANAKRAWEGRIELNPGQPTRLWLWSRSRAGQQSPARCNGLLETEAETPRVLLDCESAEAGRYRMYLERALEPPAALAQTRRTWSTNGTSIEDLAVFESSTGGRVVAAVSGLARASGGGLYLFREEAGEFRPLDVRVDYGFLRRVSASSDGRYVLAGGDADLFAVDLESLTVVGHVSVAGGGDDRFAGLVGTGVNEGVVAFGRGSAARVEWQRYRLAPLEALGLRHAAEDAQLVQLVASGSGLSAPLLMLVARSAGGRVLELDRETLEIVASYELPSRESRGLARGLDGEEAVFADHRGFGTLRLGSGVTSPYLPVPYFSRPSVVGYDPERDWILAGGSPEGGGQGYLYPVDRTTARPVPRGLALPGAPLALVVYRGTLFVAEGNRIHEVPLPSPR